MKAIHIKLVNDIKQIKVIPILIFVYGFAVGQFSMAKAEAVEETSKPVVREVSSLEKNIAKVVAKLIQDYHYGGKKLTDEVSHLFFDEYFLRLDPNRYFFLEDDIKELSSYKDILDDLLILGNIDFAFEVYDRLLKRIKERVDYVKRSVHNGLDFSKEESLIIDRSEVPWAKNSEELDEVWRKRIKNQLLLYQFLLEEESKENDLKLLETQATPEEKVIKRYENYYKYFLDNDNADILEHYLSSLLRTFDPHSSYLNWRSIEDFDIHMRLSLQGIGATLKSEDGYTEVVSLVYGGPAYRDGRLQGGDRIISVAQGLNPAEDVIDMPLKKVVRKIRGEKGTEVRLTVIKSLNSVPKVINLIRDQVKLTDEEAKGRVRDLTTINGKTLNLGIIDVPSFYADFEALKENKKDAKITSRDVKNIIDGMIEKDKVDGLLIDLRSNGGGSLEEAINLTGLFIPEGPVVQVRNRRGVQVRNDNDNGFYYSLPLVVMVNRSSASASEIFTAAIKDYDRGIIVGDKNTHGKGTVQTVLKLDRLHPFRNKKSGAMKYTMAKFYRVTGASTQKKGVEPDLVYPSFLDHLEIGEEYLDHIMPWDEIQPQNIKKVVNISSVRSQIKERAEKRLKNDRKFTELSEDIANYGERNKKKTLTLNKKQRIAMAEEDEYWAKRSRSVLGNRRKDQEDEKNKNIDLEKETMEEFEDLYLEESLNILADLIELSEKDKIAKRASSNDLIKQ